MTCNNTSTGFSGSLQFWDTLSKLTSLGRILITGVNGRTNRETGGRDPAAGIPSWHGSHEHGDTEPKHDGGHETAHAKTDHGRGGGASSQDTANAEQGGLLRTHLVTSLYRCAQLHIHTPVHAVYTSKHLSMPSFTNWSSGEAGQQPNTRMCARTNHRAVENQTQEKSNEATSLESNSQPSCCGMNKGHGCIMWSDPSCLQVGGDTPVVPLSQVGAQHRTRTHRMP